MPLNSEIATRSIEAVIHAERQSLFRFAGDVGPIQPIPRIKRIYFALNSPIDSPAAIKESSQSEVVKTFIGRYEPEYIGEPRSVEVVGRETITSPFKDGETSMACEVDWDTLCFLFVSTMGYCDFWAIWSPLTAWWMVNGKGSAFCTKSRIFCCGMFSAVGIGSARGR